MRREAKPILCYVTDRRGLVAGAAGTDAGALAAALAVIERAIAAGVDWIQIREKDLPGRELLQLTRSAVAAARTQRAATESVGVRAQPRGASALLTGSTRILVNDRLDVALSAGAAGVHLGEQSLPVAEVVRWRREAAQPQFLVGASCHSLAAAVEAERSGADYVIFGPVFDTPSKAAYGAPQGVERLAEVCRNVRLPVIAIGGITAENAAQCLAAGASGVAAIRLFQESSALAAVIRSLRAPPQR